MKSGSIWVARVQAYVLKGRNIIKIPIVQRYSWNLKKLLQLRSLAAVFIQSDGTWKVTDSRFRVGYAYEELRHKESKVAWYRVLWFNHYIPKHAVVSWMTLLDRLPTRSRLLDWGVVLESDLCLLCKNYQETRDHLFCSCNYTRSIWVRILQLCGLSRSIGNRQQEMGWIVRRRKGKALISTILRIAWGALCYFIWKERNGRLHGKQAKDSEAVLELIAEAVRLRLYEMTRVKGDPLDLALKESWKLCIDFV